MTSCPPPVATTLFEFAGRKATPQSNLALFLTNVKLPVELYIIAVLPATKSAEESPNNRFAGINPSFTRENINSAAPIASLESRYVSVPASLLIIPPFCIINIENGH